uniref:uncharacterized protein LOC122585830 isoform X1 n=1 Tax=Erigeron canadensis TaxID=72917 RepID=UPI001CB8D5AA|nr:uncharacterized protein LOC122585830 isoform X1 [Erigeron canadensis]
MTLTGTDSQNTLDREPNLPCLDIVDGDGEDYFNICVPLSRASLSGNWEAAKVILDKRPELVSFAITECYDTPLHVAALGEETKQMLDLVKNLMLRMGNQDLELENNLSSTALVLAAATGKIKMVKILVNQNINLLNIPNGNGLLPLQIAAQYGRRKIVKFLYGASRRLSDYSWTHEKRSWLVEKCAECDLFGVALKIVKDRPELASNALVMRALARKSVALNRAEPNFILKIIKSIFRAIKIKVGAADEDDTKDAVELLKTVWKEIIRTVPKNEIIIRIANSGALFVAAEKGNTRFIVELLRAFPGLIWSKNIESHTIFHVAVLNRQQDIYNLLYEIASLKDVLVATPDKDGNNILHLVGLSSQKMRSKVSGASLLMQRELLWYKEVEKLLPPPLREATNKAGKTPHEIFSKENEDLVSKGLIWMKEDCIVVAALIVTVAMTVAFTVPGGYVQDHGNPIFIHKRSFIVFVIADAVCLFSSSTSLLVLLSMLTSRYGQRDFLSSVPRKVMLGLTTLFISVAALMVTFSASFFVLYHNGLKWVPILIAIFATMPVMVFAAFQFPLLVDMFRSRYDSHYLFKPKKRDLFIPDPPKG